MSGLGRRTRHRDEVLPQYLLCSVLGFWSPRLQCDGPLVSKTGIINLLPLFYSLIWSWGKEKHYDLRATTPRHKGSRVQLCFGFGRSHLCLHTRGLTRAVRCTPYDTPVPVPLPAGARGVGARCPCLVLPSPKPFHRDGNKPSPKPARTHRVFNMIPFSIRFTRSYKRKRYSGPGSTSHTY